MIDIDKSWNDDFSVFGNWWLPGKADEPVAGRLTYAGGSIHVDLLGGFHGDTMLGILRQAGADKLPVVIGRAEGKLFTLLDCRYIATNLHSESQGTWRLDAARAIEGAIFGDAASVRSTTIAFRQHYLEEWLCDSPVTRTEEGAGKDAVFTRQYRVPERREFDLPSQSCTLATESTSKITMAGHDDAITHRAYWSANFQGDQSLETLEAVAFNMSGLLTFLIGTRTSISHMAIEVDPFRAAGREIRRFARVYVRHYQHEPAEQFHWMRQRFAFPLVHEQFGEILQRWFDRNEQLMVTHDLHAGAQFGRDQPIRFKFLNLVHALESYDRCKGGRTYMSEEDYQAARRSITNAIPESLDSGHRASLKNKIKYGYEISLRSRMTKMLDELPLELQRLVCQDAKKFCSTVADTRNYFSHYTEELKAKAVTESEDLVWLTRRLMVWVTSLLLLEYKLSPEHVEAAIERSPEMQWFLRYAPRI